MACIAVVLCPAASQAKPDPPPAFYSLESWAPVHRWELFAVPAALAVTLAIDLTPYPAARWRGGILFDNWVTDRLALKSDAARSRAGTASTVLVAGVGALPFLLDSIWLTGSKHGRADLAFQLFMVDAEALTLTGLLTEITKRATGRERPTGGVETDSFFSGHTSIAASAATVVCLQHLQLELLGDKTADAAVCGAAAAAALGTGLLRVMADRHYASDVVVGAAVGVGTALLVYDLRVRETPAPRISPVLRPDSLGLSLAGGF